jgi:hypothetical protein
VNSTSDGRDNSMIKRACRLSILVVAGAMTMVSCGGGGGGSSMPITVFITTDVSNIETFQTVPFAASVTGTSNTTVTWQLTCGATGSVCGSITASGMYVAPNTVPTVATVNSTDPATVTVTATSQANTAISNSVAFTIDSLNLQTYTAPVPLGSSGGSANAICGTGASEFCFGGTLGSLLTNGTNFFILSNNHVLGLSDGGAVGQEVTQPGVIETNCSLTGTINVAKVSTIINLQTQPSPPVDVTTAQIITTPSPQVDTTGSILELGTLTMVNGVQVPQPAPPAAGTGITTAAGKLLAKSGRTTGLTCSAVEATDVSMLVVQYESGCSTTPFNVTYNDEITVANMSNGQSFIGDGDSGSLAVDELTAEPVALMFAGSDSDAVGNPVADVLNALHASTGGTYSFVGAGQHAVPGCSLPGLSSVTITPSAATLPAGTAQRGQTAATNNSSQIMSTPGVSAYGGGGSLDAPQEPAVMIVVAPGASHAGIPATIDGVRTRLVESNSTTAHGPLTPQQTAQLTTQSEQAQTITISDAAIAQTKSIKEQYAASLMTDPAVIGVGVSASLDSPGDPALMIYVLKGKAHGAIPATIDGVRTRIKETGPFRANVAHPLKSPTTAAGCRVPKTSPTTGLNATPTALNAAPPSRSASE